MTKNPDSSAEIGPLMRICHELDLIGLVEDDYGMELVVAGNIISLDLSIAQVYDQHWRAFLQRGIYHAYMQRMHSRSTRHSSPGSSTAVKVEPVTPGRSTFETGDSETLLATVQPMLVYTGLIEQLQSFFKVRKLSNSASAKVEGTDSGDLEGWELLMKERLMNVKEMIGFSKEFLSWLEDMMSASSLQEAFDIMGVLTDVLSCSN